jgi:hypothetical protein
MIPLKFLPRLLLVTILFSCNGCVQGQREADRQDFSGLEIVKRTDSDHEDLRFTLSSVAMFSEFSKDGKLLFVGKMSGGVAAVNMNSGETVWETRQKQSFVLGDSNRIYVRTSAGYSLFDAESGQNIQDLVWESEPGFGHPNKNMFETDGGKTIVFSPYRHDVINRMSTKTGISETLFDYADQSPEKFKKSRSPGINLLGVENDSLVFIANERLAAMDLKSREVVILDEVRKYSGTITGKRAQEFYLLSDSNELVTINMEKNKPVLTSERCGDFPKSSMGKIIPELGVIVFGKGTGKKSQSSLVVRGYDGEIKKTIPFGNQGMLELQYSHQAQRLIALSCGLELGVWDTSNWKFDK